MQHWIWRRCVSFPPAIHRIANSPEMDPWRINPGYDRPIARRIAEERGVPRSMFGQVKMGSVVLFPSPRLPQNPQLREEFLNALVDAGVIYRWQTKAWPAASTLSLRSNAATRRLQCS